MIYINEKDATVVINPGALLGLQAISVQSAAWFILYNYYNLR